MQDPIGVPACFSSAEKLAGDPAAVTRPGQSVFISTYRTKMADQCRFITVTWFKNLLLHGLSVAVDGPPGRPESHCTCKVELKPWYFWRKHGCKSFTVDEKAVDVFWDLRAAKFNGETEPSSDYYVAVVCDEEVALLLGDLKKDAYRKTKCRPALVDPCLVSRKEHIFGKKKFCTKVKFHEKGRLHEISIECQSKPDPEMEIRIDEHLVIFVKHLQWKFRGNESIHVNKGRLEIYWDVHDWLFSTGLRRALFIVKPNLPLTSSSPSMSSPSLSLASTPLSSQTGSSGSAEGLNNGGGPSEFCLFLYAWKVE